MNKIDTKSVLIGFLGALDNNGTSFESGLPNIAAVDENIKFLIPA